MDYSKVKEGLKDFKDVDVNIYLSHLRELETKKKNGSNVNTWFSKFTDNKAIALFKEVAQTGVLIDGSSVTVGYKGKILVSYDYRAYKNRVLSKYPNSSFDTYLVHKGDEFTLHKDSGNVTYKHSVNNPFATDKEIIGAYCFIVNSKGSFIETINLDDIKAMRAVAKTSYIWDKWRGEMVLKSVVKRACKRHYNDLVAAIDIIDNDNYDLSQEITEDTEDKFKKLAAKKQQENEGK